MRSNLHIRVRERGKLITSRDGHNVWVEAGDAYLASMLAYDSFGPDTAETNARPLYMGFGIGGARQNNSAVADAAPFSTGYPVGADPNATNGHEYDDENPMLPVISTLERPVRFSGGSTAYPGSGSDEWRRRVQMISHLNPTETTYHLELLPASGDLVYAPYTPVVPVSEVGLFLSSVATLGLPFQELLAYHTFDTIDLASPYEIEVTWSVRF